MNPSNKSGTNRGGGRRPHVSARSTPSVAQPKMAIASKINKQPVAPPVYKPQQGPRAVQAKWANTSNRRQPSTTQPVERAQSPASVTRQMTSVLQPKVGRPTVIQLKKCVSCPHKAHAGTCTVQVDAGGGKTKACGCKSHSIKFDSGQKINPGGGRRARMLEAKAGGGK